MTIKTSLDTGMNLPEDVRRMAKWYGHILASRERGLLTALNGICFGRREL
jgi:hypothetical protein